jgi:hypothetical protein
MARKPKATKPQGTPAPAKLPGVIYCGPTLPKGRLVSMVVFRGDLPAYVTALIAECPDIANCLIPLRDFPQVAGTLKNSTSKVGQAVKAITKHFGAAANTEPEGRQVSHTTPLQDRINLKLGK